MSESTLTTTAQRYAQARHAAVDGFNCVDCTVVEGYIAEWERTDEEARKDLPFGAEFLANAPVEPVADLIDGTDPHARENAWIEQVAALEEQIRSLQSDLNYTRTQRDANARAINETLEAFKDSVRDVALRYAKDHGWCRVVNEALEELGIHGKSRFQVEVTLTRTLYIDAADEETARNRVQYLVDTKEINYSSESTEDNIEATGSDFNLEIDEMDD